MAYACMYLVVGIVDCLAHEVGSLAVAHLQVEALLQVFKRMATPIAG